METDNTWKPLGAVAGRIAAKLIAARKEIEKPAAPGPKAESGGSARALRRKARHPKTGVQGNPTGEASRIATGCGDEVGGRAAGWRSKHPSPSGSVRHRGETPRTTGNVIDYRERPTLLAAWSGGRKPRHDRRSFCKSNRAAKSSSDTPSRQATTEK